MFPGFFKARFKGFHLCFATRNDLLREVSEHLKICFFKSVSQRKDLLTILVSEETRQDGPWFPILGFADAMHALDFDGSCI